MNRAIWSKGKRTIAGQWIFLWAANEFFVALDNGKSFRVCGESPEWRGWKRVV